MPVVASSPRPDLGRLAVSALAPRTPAAFCWKGKTRYTDMAVKKKAAAKRASSPSSSTGSAPAAPSTPSILERYAQYKLIIKPSAIHRWGVFAGEPIPKGHKIIEYTGERISRRETARRAERPLNYLFTLDNYWTLDGSVGGSGAEFINHCCDPNCYAWIFKGHILYMAGRDIRKGEELTIDYHFDPDVPEVKCGCGAASCRGTINLKKKRRPKAVARHV